MLLPLPVKITLSALTMILLGGLGGYLTASAIGSWYSTLNKPPGTPPNWLFGPVWTILYAMIGASFALIWHQGHLGKTRPSFFFVLQFLLNLAWTPVFFGAHQIGAALLLLILLWLAIAATIREFARLSKPAAYLLIPYLIWVSYATYLNAGHAFLN